jgi:hypothetical protein
MAWRNSSFGARIRDMTSSQGYCYEIGLASFNPNWILLSYAISYIYSNSCQFRVPRFPEFSPWDPQRSRACTSWDPPAERAAAQPLAKDTPWTALDILIRWQVNVLLCLKYWWFQGLGSSQEFSIEIMITTRDRKRTLKPPIWILDHGSASVNGQTSQGFKSRRKRWPIIWWIGNALDSRRFQWRRTCSDSSFLPFSWSETTSGPSKGLAVQSFAVPRAGWEVPAFYVKLYII